MTSETWDINSLGGVIIEHEGKKVKIKGNMRVKCDGVMFGRKNSSVVETKEKKGADVYIKIGQYSSGSKHDFLGNHGGTTTFSFLYGNLVELDK